MLAGLGVGGLRGTHSVPSSTLSGGLPCIHAQVTDQDSTPSPNATLWNVLAGHLQPSQAGLSSRKWKPCLMFKDAPGRGAGCRGVSGSGSPSVKKRSVV